MRHVHPSKRARVAGLLWAVLAPACASSSNAPTSLATDARGDGAIDAAADAAGDGSGDAPAFSLGLSPPAVDCRPYAAAALCALRVSPRGSADGDGLTWQTAFADVQDALDRATCGCDVWIAGGTYLPTRSLDAAGATPDPRNRSFVLWPGEHVFGGFAGSELSVDTRSSPVATVLSGDLGAPGVPDDNAYHVVVGADGAALDSLEISGGEANGFEPGQGVGAGLFSLAADMSLHGVSVVDNDADQGAGYFGDERSRPHVDTCLFARNTATDGGGMVVLGDSAVVAHSQFEDNVGVFSGPAITDFAGTLTVTDSRFLRNRGDSGGALTVSAGHAAFERCWFEGNQAGSFGGALLVRFGASASLSSSVLYANASVGFGGAIAIWTGAAELEGVTLVDDYAGFGGAFLVKDGSRLGLSDTVVWRDADDAGDAFYLDGDGNTIDADTCALPAEVASTNSFAADPRLVNAPLATRFTVQAATAAGSVPVTGADQVFALADVIELGADGNERTVIGVAGDVLSFMPPLAAPGPRFLRVDRWGQEPLGADLAPAAGSPLVDAASANAPALDVFGHPRVGPPDIGAIELSP